jgi:bacteriocin biosynthesis cyclodehydratase domain-containing protein
MTELAVDPGWRAFAVDGGVELTAGADLAYLLPDLPAADAAFLVNLFGSTRDGSSERFDPDRMPESVRHLIPRLRALGALRPTGLPDRPDLTVCLAILGDEPPALRPTLANTMSIVDTDADLILVVRTTSTWLDVTTAAARFHGPHLLLDLAYHHCVSIGPLVVPGASACLGCLALRITRRWGDRPPPDAPHGLADPTLPAAVAAHLIRRIGTGSLTLLDRVITCDLDELATTTEHVLPSAGCPICPQVTVGRVALPWEEA